MTAVKKVLKDMDDNFYIHANFGGINSISEHIYRTTWITAKIRANNIIFTIILSERHRKQSILRHNLQSHQLIPRNTF